MKKLILFTASLLFCRSFICHAQTSQQRADSSSLKDISLSEVGIAGKGKKLPNIQRISVRAPENIKIDGSPEEWDTYQAFNTATGVFYTLSNDDDNLYLVIRATRLRIVYKIMESDIAFTVNTGGKKSRDNKKNIVFTYPLLDSNIRSFIVVNAGLRVKPDITLGAAKDVWIDEFYSHFPPATAAMNSSAAKAFALDARQIKVEGINGITDTVIATDNEKGIKVGARIDKKSAYTYELSIPLKYLGLSVQNGDKFSYSIRVDGSKKTLFGLWMRADPMMGQKPSEAPMVYTNEDLRTTTDLWGDYTLIKK